MIYAKALMVWCLIAMVEMVHGILRAKLLAPKVGDFRSRQIAVFTGSILIFITTYVTFSWIGYVSSSQAFVVGGMWVVCMVLFEFTVGHYIFRFPWKWLLNDFNLFKGRLLAIGMILLGLAPWLCGRWKNFW